ncbi:YtzI protein [Virgibacillus ainsalahensis]
MWGYILLSVGIAAIVLLLSMVTISKGYGYKHTVDPHPDEKKKDKLDEEKDDEK